MKLLGSITPEYIDNEGEVVNGEYIGGAIILLTERETSLLRALQDVWDGETYRFPVRANPNNVNMEKQFQAVHAYIEARFAINEFKSAVCGLEDYLVKSDEL